MTKTWCTGLSPVNISVWVFLQKMNFGAQNILETHSRLPWTHNINRKTAEKTFPNQSLMHLCHLVNKNKSKCLCEREDRSWPPQKCLQTGSQKCFGGSLGYCFCLSLMDCQFQTPEGLQMNVTRATKNFSVSRGGGGNHQIAVSHTHPLTAPISDLAVNVCNSVMSNSKSFCVQVYRV